MPQYDLDYLLTLLPEEARKRRRENTLFYGMLNQQPGRREAIFVDGLQVGDWLGVLINDALIYRLMH